MTREYMPDKTFANGIYFKMPHEKAPDFVVGKLSIEKQKAIEFLKTQADGWINCDIKRSKKGEYYIEVNDWKPNKDLPKKTQKDEIPF